MDTPHDTLTQDTSTATAQPVTTESDGNKVLTLTLDSFFSMNPFKRYANIFNINREGYKNYISQAEFTIAAVDGKPKRTFYIKLAEPGYLVGKHPKILEEDFLTEGREYRMYEKMGGKDAPFDFEVVSVNAKFEELIKRIENYNAETIEQYNSQIKKEKELQEKYAETRDNLLDGSLKNSCTITVEDITDRRVDANRIGEGGASRKSRRARKSRKSTKASNKSKKSGRKSRRNSRR